MIDLSYDAPDRFTRAGTKSYAYEDNGNQTSAGAVVRALERHHRGGVDRPRH